MADSQFNSESLESESEFKSESKSIHLHFQGSILGFYVSISTAGDSWQAMNRVARAQIRMDSRDPIVAVSHNKRGQIGLSLRAICVHDRRICRPTVERPHDSQWKSSHTHRVLLALK